MIDSGAEPIAIVGAGVILPGADSPEALWRNVLEARTEFRPAPPGRWRFHPRRSRQGNPEADSVSSEVGCFVDLDLAGSAAAPGCDPMFSLAIAAGRRALADAGLGDVDPDRFAIILGNIILPTEASAAAGERFLAELRGGTPVLSDPDPGAHRVGGLPAALVARDLGLRGSAYTLDAACASSLYAVKLACDELRAGRADAVLAGGLSRPDALYTQMGFTQLRALSARGRCTPFDAAADGLVVGEGCGLVVLRRLADARANGERVRALVRGVGLANDVRGSLMSPDSEGQVRAMRAAYAAAGWPPESVGLIECHGTGTPVGDAVEIAGLRTLWDTAEGRVAIGSVKGNIGHLLTAGGAAGLVKTVLALEHAVLPPTAGYESPSPGLGLTGSPFRVLREPEPWSTPPGRPRRAAVSAFGFGGIDAHVLLEAPAHGPDPSMPPRARPQPDEDGVVIVGVGAHFGPWADAAELSGAVLAENEAAPRPPPNWWGHPAAARHPGFYLDEFSLPVARFRIPPSEIAETLPQQLLALQVAAQALDDAGLGARDQPGLATGVFFGVGLDMSTTSFTARWAALAANRPPGAAEPPLTANRTMGSLGSIVASRIARAFGAGGPAFTVADEERSAALALTLGVAALRRGEVDVAIVGAVDLAGDPRAVLARPADADRQPPGEGAVALVLQRAADAARTRRRCYAAVHECTSEVSANERQIDHLVLETPGARRHIAVHERVGETGAASGGAGLAAAARWLRATPDALGATVVAGADRRRRVTVLAPPPRSSPRGDESGRLEPVRGPPPRGTRPGVAGRPEVTVRNRPPELGPCPPSRAGPAGRPPSFGVEALGFGLPRPAAGAPATGTTALAPTLVEPLAAASLAAGRAHHAYLAASRRFADALTVAGRAAAAMAAATGRAPVAAPARDVDPSGHAEAAPMPRAFDRDACLSFAVGEIGAVLGPRYRDVDAFPTRVRLPDEPLMLVDRILVVDGEPGKLGPGRVVTEHDVRPGAWYLEAGHAPTSVSIEAGQADLFLCAYLGIDRETRGLARYRLLDAAVTFHRALPAAGATLRYDIRIERFFRLGQTWLFRFGFEASADGRPLLTMRDGCAGFFTASELASGRGLVGAGRGAPGVGADLGSAPTWDLAPRPRAAERYDAAALGRLRDGDLAALGPDFAPAAGSTKLAALPGGRLQLIHRVSALESDGGRYARGRIVAEAEVTGDEWFLTCHFVDDQVMPGTLMYEGSLHAFRLLLLRYGWIAEAEERFEPLPGVTSRLRCRGQVTAATRTVAYEVHLKSIGYAEDGTPEALADAVMYGDGRPIVEMQDMSLRLSGSTRERLAARWVSRPPPGPSPVPAVKRRVEPPWEALPPPDPTPGRPAHFSHRQVLEFATGRPSAAFGEGYAPFDTHRRLARLPRPPFGFLHRITEIEGCEPWRLEAGGTVEAQLDPAPDDWYFDADGSGRMPYSVLLETALQPCGWLAAYLGSALHGGEADLAFRNLQGRATVLGSVPRPPPGAPATVATRLTLLEVSRAAQMIVQRFAFRVANRVGPLLVGETTFGFFTREALARQTGITGLAARAPASPGSRGAAGVPFPVAGPAAPSPRLRMLERVDAYVRDGGSHGLGFVRCSSPIDASRWYFDAHFYQDPVCPGSLGLEALLQCLRFAAAERWGEAARGMLPATGSEHAWWYRGQVLRQHESYAVEAEITAIDDDAGTIRADGLLEVDGRVIYRMSGFALTMPG